jgi:two-component system, NtrC family, sensor kinase
MKIMTTRFLYALGAFVLVAVLGLLYMQTRTVNSNTHNEIINTLRELKQVDTEWNVDVLRAKTGLDSNYDKVASPLPLIESLKTSLDAKSSDAWQNRAEANARLLPLLDKYAKLMDAKIVAIERFKSQNAILRNSSRYLPVAATDLVEATRGSAGTAAVKADIERSLNTLLTDTMTYSLTPDEPLRLRIDEGTKQISLLTASLPIEVRERTETLVAHVGTVLKQQESGAKLLAELSALPTAKAIDNLSDANTQEQEKLLGGQQIFSQALVAYSGFLLLLLAYAAWRVYRYYSLLNKSNETLNKTNYELKESQVHLV